METQQIINNLNKIFIYILEQENISLIETDTANDIDGWDSITHMIIVEEIEDTYNIKFKLMDLMNMNNIGDLINLIQKKIKIII